MKSVQLVPIKTKYTDTLLLGGQPGVSDLHIKRVIFQESISGQVHAPIEGIISVWKMKSIWHRILFLFSGEINFQCWGKTHPPICLIAGDYLKEVLPK